MEKRPPTSKNPPRGNLGEDSVKQSIGYISLVVRDYDAAIDFYVHKLDFTLVEDTPIEAQKKRWGF
jgi:hypothetical protein